ncbi:MAG TPA: VTT domain-containing protein [Pyrinomonadaceae bacterium]|nr:VTT domain-containing protein [Pyrinomonadaceae bacterium]
MKWLLHKFTNGLAYVSQHLVVYGPFGLFAIALLDSALIPLPGGPDAVMIILSAARPAWTPVYVLAATLGSVIGCVIFYYISRRAGRSALKRFSPERQARVKELIDRYDVLTVLVASVLPPPFPFKLFIATAGVFRFSVLRFAAAVAVGRAFRYALEGYLAAHYGTHARELLAQYYPYIGLGVAALIVAAFVTRNLLKQRNKASGERAATAVGAESKSELL